MVNNNNLPPVKKFHGSITNALVEEVLTGRETEQYHLISLVGEPCKRTNLVGDPENNQETKVISVWGMGGLVKELSGLLNYKCLIVLDGISTTPEWVLVRSCLKNAGMAIVTTRERYVAKHCSAEDTSMYRLEGLNDAAALDLFKNKVLFCISDVFSFLLHEYFLLYPFAEFDFRR
jgi:hypothetical protein